MAKKKISEFRPQRVNANKHTARGLGMLDKSMADNGFIGAMTSAADGEIFDGSARLETAYERFGEDVEPIIVDADGTRPIIVRRIDIPSADDPKAKKLAIAANRIASVDLDWDAEVLASIADEVDISDMFFEDELAAILGDEIQEEQTEYQAPEDQGDRLSNDEIPESSVRMMQLFLDTETHPLFLEMIEALNGIYGTDNPTDCVMAGLRELCQNHAVDLQTS